ncbi:hypothetical protein [Planococcus sp. MB-3u-03]|nr:hypothetical protein [Planococcus sp. MB-3u-03]
MTVVYDMSLLGLNVGTYTLVERTLENGTSLILKKLKIPDGFHMLYP